MLPRGGGSSARRAAPRARAARRRRRPCRLRRGPLRCGTSRPRWTPAQAEAHRWGRRLKSSPTSRSARAASPIVALLYGGKQACSASRGRARGRDDLRATATIFELRNADAGQDGARRRAEAFVVERALDVPLRERALVRFGATRLVEI